MSTEPRFDAIQRHEVSRKLIHLTSLVYPLLYLFVLDRNQMLWLSGAVLSVLLLSELLRCFSDHFARLYRKLFGFALRDHEAFGLVGATYFLLGVFFCVLLFDQPVVIMALSILVISDTCASLIGLRFGRKRRGWPKSIEGTAAFIASAACIVVLGANYFAYPLVPLLWAALISGLLETFHKQIGLDDNILIPLGFSASATFWL